MKRKTWKMKLKHFRNFKGVLFNLLLEDKGVHTATLWPEYFDSLEDREDRKHFERAYDFAYAKLGMKEDMTMTNEVEIVEFLSLLPQGYKYGYTYESNDNVKGLIRRGKAIRLLDSIEKEAVKVTI